MDDIQALLRETISEFMGNGLEAELDDELGYSKYDYRNKATDNKPERAQHDAVENEIRRGRDTNAARPEGRI